MSAEHERRACDLPAGELQRAFDKESTTSNVAAHVTSCEPCSGSLNVLQTQRDAVRYLTTEQTAAARRTAVEFVLSQSATAGRQKLADLLYELEKALFQLVPPAQARWDPWTNPRPAGLVLGEVVRTQSRLVGAGHAPRSEVAVASRDFDDSGRALRACFNCLETLRGIEGESDRYVAGFAQAAIADGRPLDAERALRGILSRPSSQSMQQLAKRNIVLALIHQHRFPDAASFAEDALKSAPSDSRLLYNYAVSLAWLDRRQEFDGVCSRLAEQVGRDPSSRLSSVIKHQAGTLAGRLGTTRESVLSAFGISPPTTGTG